jgi:hypothetical protein
MDFLSGYMLILSMPLFSPAALQAYRAETYNTLPGKHLASADEAVEFVNRRGFTFFWAIKGLTLPSLWVAAAGDRPVPDEHDDPGHVTWGWKDSLLGQKRWYYGRVLKRRNAMISLAALPFFYALSPNLGDPENDYLDQYHQGTMTAESKSLYETLLNEGPLDTIALRKAARLSSPGSDSRYTKALDDLQMEFKVIPVGISPVGAWRYAFIYELTHRHFPDLIPQAGQIYESDARHTLIRMYIDSVGAVPMTEISRVFSWKHDITERSLKPILAGGKVVMAGFPQQNQPWVGLAQLIEPA